MATIIGQHQVAELTQPINGSSPIDANTVRGNDNTVRSAYVNHDNDTGIHVQSSTLAARPSAGIAGRKWITADTGVYNLWYDDGSVWHEVGNSTVEIEVLADANLVVGDVVKITGYNNGQGCPTVNKVSSAADVAFGIVDLPISLNTKGYIINTGIARDINTSAFAVGTILYPNTSGGFTSTKPTSGSYQIAAYVLRQNTNNGVLFVEFSGPRIVESTANTASTLVLRDASGDFSAGTITASLIGNAISATTASTASALSSARTFALTGDITGSVSSDLTSGASITASIGTGVIVDADINASADIVDTKLATINTAGKVANTATTATNLNTPNAIVARDASGNFSAETITATLSGAAPAGSLSGTTLASGVVSSSLTSVGTLGSLAVTGDLTVDTSTLKVDSVNNRVGIGTATPTAGFKLEVSGGDLAVNGLTCGRGNGGFLNSTAFGAGALGSEVAGGYNVGIGYFALSQSTNGQQNVAVGEESMLNGTSPDFCTAVGSVSLWSIDAGQSNTAIGFASLYSTTNGNNNTAIGYNAGYGTGTNANTTGANNTFVGYQSVGASATASNVITLGNSSIATLRCQVTTITSLSDARDKKDIVDVPAGLSFVRALKPRAFVWHMRDGGKVDVPEFGFIAQELKEVQVETGIAVPGLVYDENPERLEASPSVLFPVLVKALQEAADRIESLEARLVAAGIN